MLKRLDALIHPLRKHASFADVPVRYSVLALCIFGLLLSAFSLVGFGVGWLAFVVSAVLVGVGLHDLRQTRHAILRNYPVIGHLRFLFEYIRPEMRQYFIEGNREAMPFSRAQRSLVYQRAAHQQRQPAHAKPHHAERRQQQTKNAQRQSAVAHGHIRETCVSSQRGDKGVESLEHGGAFKKCRCRNPIVREGGRYTAHHKSAAWRLNLFPPHEPPC